MAVLPHGPSYFSLLSEKQKISEAAIMADHSA